MRCRGFGFFVSCFGRVLVRRSEGEEVWWVLGRVGWVGERLEGILVWTFSIEGLVCLRFFRLVGLVYS